MIRRLLQAYRARQLRKMTARREAGYRWAAGELLRNGDVLAIEQWIDAAAKTNNVDSFDNGAHMAIADFENARRAGSL